MNEKLWWYLARTSGVVGWALLAAATIWGLVVSTRLTSKKPPRGWLLDLHRFLGGLSVTFTAVHVVALVADSYVQFGPAEILVPMASEWRPGAVAWGVVSMYVLIAVELTSLLMKKLPYKVWRMLHTGSAVLYVTSTAHLITAGTDTANGLLRWLAILTSLAVLFLVVYRVVMPKRGAKRAAAAPADRPARTPRAAAADGAPVARTPRVPRTGVEAPQAAAPPAEAEAPEAAAAPAEAEAPPAAAAATAS